jgi:hypothetical protein
MDIEVQEGLRRNLKEALQALALPPAEQIRVTEPGCVMCELYEDFCSDYPAYISMFDPELSEDQRNLLLAVAGNLENIPNEAFVCYDNSCLEHQAWAEVRSSAAAALSALGWKMELPATYQEVEPGVWRRPQGENSR